MINYQIEIFVVVLIKILYLTLEAFHLLRAHSAKAHVGHRLILIATDLDSW